MDTALQIVVVGGGTMGSDVAIVGARGGHHVQVIESHAQRAEQLPQCIAQRLEELGLGGRAEYIRVKPSSQSVDWSTVDLVIECLPEQIAMKQALFKELAHLCGPQTILSSNSSSFPISAIAQGLPTQERMIGLHFFMPAHLIPCVEVVCGEQTDLGIAQRLQQIMTQCGMVPVLVKKDLPGFLANRLQHALSREAFALIDAGIASAEDVDKAVRFGFGFRYLAAGPVLQRDHAGIEIHAAAGASIYPSLNNAPHIADCLRTKVETHNLGMKTGAGFFQWTPETIAAEKERYNHLLKEGLRLISQEISTVK